MGIFFKQKVFITLAIKIIFSNMQFKLIFASTLLMLLGSCSNSSNQEIDFSDAIPTVYMPLANGNYWNYDVQQVNPGALNTPMGLDHLYIANDTIINNSTYKKMKTTADPFGFFSRTLRNNGVKINGSSLVATGTFNMNFPGLTTPVVISLNNFAFFKENASVNTELSSASGTFHQTVSGYPLDIEYTLKSIAQESLSSFSSNGINYPNVKKTRLILYLKITTTSSGITATLLTNQPVLTINEYFAKNLGNVYTNTYFHYDINASVASSFGIPASDSQTEEEFLTTYHLN